jgi:hypothetical protein
MTGQGLRSSGIIVLTMRFSVTRDTSQVTDMTMRGAVTLRRNLSIEVNSVCQTRHEE